MTEPDVNLGQKNAFICSLHVMLVSAEKTSQALLASTILSRSLTHSPLHTLYLTLIPLNDFLLIYFLLFNILHFTHSHILTHAFYDKGLNK